MAQNMRSGGQPIRPGPHIGFYDVPESQHYLRSEANFKLHIKMQFSMHIRHFHSLKRNSAQAAQKQPFSKPMCSCNASIPRKCGFWLFKLIYSD